MTATLALPTIDVAHTLGSVTFGAGSPLGTTGWRAFSVDSSGALNVELDVVKWGDITETIGQQTTCQISLAASDTAGLAAVTPWEDEVQIYRGTELVGWFVPMPWRWSTGSATVDIGLVDVSVWLTRRACLLDEAETNLIRNPGFEDSPDFARWQTFGAPSIDAVTFVEGSQSALLSATTDRVVQRLVVRRAMTLAVSCQVRVDSGTWVAAALTSGLEVFATPWTGFGGKDIMAVSRVTSVTTQDSWVTLACSVPLTEGYWDVYVRIWGVDGAMNVDNVRAVPFRTPRRTVAAGIFPPEEVPQIDTGELVRTTALGALSDLNIGVVAPDTGVMIDDEVGAWDDKYVAEMLDVVRRLDRPSDWSMDYTPGTRTLRMFTPPSTRGSASGVTLSASNQVTASGSSDATSRRTRVIVLGEGGFSVVVESPGDDPGGHRLDEIVQAPAGTPLGELQAVGEDFMRSTAASTREVTVSAPWTVAGSVRLADTLTLTADVAGPAGSGTYKCVARKIDPVGDRVALTVNPS